MKKIDPALVVEVIGVIMFTIGVAMMSVPLALMALGGFLVWATEK